MSESKSLSASAWRAPSPQAQPHESFTEKWVKGELSRAQLGSWACQH